MNVLSLFSGIGGLDLGLERAGMTIAGQVEIDPWCRKVLAKHWPEVPRHDDVRTCARWWGSQPRSTVDVIAGGFPCQPVSNAGHRKAQEDPRWLWPDMASVIGDLRPAWVIGENVPGLLSLGLEDVLSGLRRLGYQARAGWLPACAMGAPHPRRRLLILAHAARCGWHERLHGSDQATPGERLEVSGHAGRSSSPELHGWWRTEPGVGRVADGVPGRVDRLRGLGNAVVPQVAEHIGRLILASAEDGR